MGLMDGLATYEIWKTGFGIFILVLFLGGAIWMENNSRKKHYISTTDCNIVNNNDSSKTQTVTYTVDGKKYVKIVPSTPVIQNNVTSYQYTWPEGSCKLYYASANPNDYSISSNPATIFTIISVVLLVFCIGTVLWFVFLRSNREVAGVVGGIDAAHTVLDIFNKRR
jgi:uncharacterized membrane protein